MNELLPWRQFALIEGPVQQKSGANCRRVLLEWCQLKIIGEDPYFQVLASVLLHFLVNIWFNKNSSLRGSRWQQYWSSELCCKHLEIMAPRVALWDRVNVFCHVWEVVDAVWLYAYLVSSIAEAQKRRAPLLLCVTGTTNCKSSVFSWYVDDMLVFVDMDGQVSLGEEPVSYHDDISPNQP